MSEPKICPVCRGSGKLNPDVSGSTTAITWVNCHGCGGQGWVIVP